jgi:hypothetical protein
MFTKIVVGFALATFAAQAQSAETVRAINANDERDVGKVVSETLFYGQTQSHQDGGDEYGEVEVLQFYVAPNRDPLNLHGRHERLVTCFFPETDPILKQIAIWPTGEQSNWTVRATVTGHIRWINPAKSGTYGVIDKNGMAPDWAAVHLSDCKFTAAK